jgi:NADH-quinone oxidoreductase subunit L
VVTPFVLASEGGEAAHAAVTAAEGVLRYTWLIAVLPFVSAALTLFFGKRTPGKGPIYGILAVGAALVGSFVVLSHFVTGGGPFQSSVDWFTIGPLQMELGIYVDGLTAVMLVVVTGVSLMVHVYSLGYMHGDVRYTWFYVVLSIFTGAMLNLVLANNLFQLLIGWEIMGVCSYLLIGHWFEEHANSSAAIKAFLTTRVGDVPFMFGIFVLIALTGFTTSNILEISETVALGEVSRVAVSVGALLLFGGTIGKSAQFPLHVWLPDAMAGPTPVSALIHAATMVAAGVYLVGRMYEVFIAADPWVLQVVGIVGMVTMFGAALVALVQDDIKKVLAYSTISQLAYMVSLMSVGEIGREAAFFHLFTHAFFKALLFLGAGSVIHAVHSNDMSDMGGLRKTMPWTFWTFVIGSISLAGLPPLAGFWSKDELLVAASKTEWLVFGAVLTTAFVTAFYTIRMVVRTFLGEYRGHGHPHESPATMTVPLVILAAATVFVGWLGAPQAGAVFFDWVYLVEPEELKFLPWVAALSTVVGLAGAATAWFVYRRQPSLEEDPTMRMGAFTRLLVNKYYLDRLYWGGIVRPIRDPLAAGVYWFNQHVIDGVVNGAASVTVVTGRIVGWFDRSVVDGVINGIGGITGAFGNALKYIQNGNVQWYAVGLFVGVVALALVFVRIV